MRLCTGVNCSTLPDAPVSSQLGVDLMNEFDPRKEISDFERRRLRSVGAVDAVVLDVTGVEFADRSRRGLGGVGRAHHLAEPRDDVVAFEHHHQGLPRAHEGRQAFEKSFAAMHGVEAFGFALAESHQSCGDDPETVRLKDFNNVAHVAGSDGIGLDDGERSLNRQFRLFRRQSRGAFKVKG